MDCVAPSRRRNRLIAAGLTLCAVIFITLVTPALHAQELERLKYNNPGLVVDLAVGLWATPMPVDTRGDGQWDLAVACVDKAYFGTYLFENPRDGKAFPVFKAGRRLGNGGVSLQISYPNGQPRVLRGPVEYPNFLKTGLSEPKPLKVGIKIPDKSSRSNRWSYVDYDGDGKTDIVVGIDDWSEYGVGKADWQNGWNAEGHWIKGPLHGYVFVLRNTGTNEAPVYAAPEQVMAGDKPVDTYGSPSPCFADFRGTGKLDLICGEFLDGFTFHENIGTRTEPKYAPGRRLKTADGKPVAMDLEIITPVSVDWNHDGRPDLVVGEEDGRVALIENTGKVDAEGTPVFSAPQYFKQEADEVDLGALDTPVGFDWNGDGAIDILSGNSAGYLIYLENLSGPGVERPRWAAPRYLEVDGKPFRIMAGPNGSLQGPAEAKWGYTALSVADWDGDGLPDLVVSSIWGQVVWLRNIGTRTAPKLAAPQPIEVEWNGPQPSMPWGWLKPQGKALLTQWRTTPVAFDWNGDGLVDLITVDQEATLCLFERRKNPDGKLVLLPPKPCIVNEKGDPFRFMNFKVNPPAGYIGCKKFAVGDWDGDGKPDIFISNHPVMWLRQVAHHNGLYIMKDMGPVVKADLGSHDPSPGLTDWNGDGIPDLVIGCEGGQVYYLRNPRPAQK